MSNTSLTEHELETLRQALRILPTTDEVESTARAVRAGADKAPKLCLCVNSLRDAYERLLAQGARNAAESQNCELTVHAGHCFRSRQTILEKLLWQSADGIVLASAALGLSAKDVQWVVKQLRTAGQSAVIVSVGVEVPGVQSLVIDDGGKIASIVRHYYTDHGARRIAFIGGPEGNEQATRRLEGYRSCIEDPELDLVAIEYQGDFLMESGESETEKLLRSHPDIQAIVCANDLMALGALKVLEARQLDKLIQVSGFDDGTYAAIGCFTTVDQNPEEQGFLALATLLNLLQGVPLSEPVQVRTDVVIGRLCGCAKVAAPPVQDKGMAEAIRQLRKTVRDSDLTRRLAVGFIEAVRKDNSELLLQPLAAFTRTAQHEELRRWRRILTELRVEVQLRTRNSEIGYTALKVLADASELLALAVRRDLLDDEARQELVSEIGRELQTASTVEKLWELAHM